MSTLAHTRDPPTRPQAFEHDPEFQRRLVIATLKRGVDEGEGFTPHAMREAVWGVMPECTQFKASLTVCIFRRFHATRVLDISAGWGDRLLGACVRAHVCATVCDVGARDCDCDR